MSNKDKVIRRIDKIRSDAAKGGYLLHTDDETVEMLVEGLIANDERYGIESCPCRLYNGTNQQNLDIVCPCVYRDDDLAEFGACYCALYIAGDKDADSQKQIPDRRPSLKDRQQSNDKKKSFEINALKYPIYRCGVCGYLCANNNPPRVCPVCKAKSERFERFM